MSRAAASVKRRDGSGCNGTAIGEPSRWFPATAGGRFVAGRVAEVMPSLVRFLIGCVVVAVIGAAGVWALATQVEPRPREMSIRVSQERFDAK